MTALDRDSTFNDEVVTFLKATGLKPKRTGVEAPWQYGIAERWVGSCRREILDHVIAVNEQYLRRLIRDYVNYQHEDRIHDSLGKDSPRGRPVEPQPSAKATVISLPRLGGLHHRYGWEADETDKGSSVEVHTFLLFCPFVSGTGKRVGAAPKTGSCLSGGTGTGEPESERCEHSRSFADAGRRKSPEAVPRQSGRTGNVIDESPRCRSQPP
jgi:hypothetical protein